VAAVTLKPFAVNADLIIIWLVMPHPGPRMAGYALALIAALLIACELLWMPVQASDSLGELLDAQDSPSIWSSFSGALGTTAYLRPLRIAQIKGLFDLAQGRWYWLVFRGFHALLLIAAAMLFVRALRISTTVDFAASSFALLVLVGLYTFRGLVREAFPINHFLETVVACLVALNLAQSRQSIWIDVGAALTFVAAALTLESGLLVWVVAAAAWLAGWRGISLRGIAVMTTLLRTQRWLPARHARACATAGAVRSTPAAVLRLQRGRIGIVCPLLGTAGRRLRGGRELAHPQAAAACRHPGCHLRRHDRSPRLGGCPAHSSCGRIRRHRPDADRVSIRARG
jgi:hypothetical protein